MNAYQIRCLDLRRHASLNENLGEVYDEVALTSATPFTKYIGQISSGLQGRIDWWVSGAASRNEMLSPLFHYFVSVKVVRCLVERGAQIEVIRVDSAAFARLLKGLNYSGSNPTIDLDTGSAWGAKRVRAFLSPFRTGLRCLGEWIAVRLSRIRNASRVPEDSAVLIDTFVIPGYVDEDRYYPGLWERLRPRLKRKTWFVPEFHGFSLWKLYRISSRARKFRRNLLLKEDYLRLSDLLYAFGHYFRVRRLNLIDCVHGEVDFRPVIEEELRAARHYYSAIRALMNFRFPLRLAQAGVKVGRTIDWCENHALDRGWNAGFGRYYPNIFRLGYQGFHVPFQSLCVTEYEKRAGVVPDEMAVMGSGFIDIRRRYCQSLPIRVAPAFRFGHFAEERNRGNSVPDHDVVAVALPIDRETSRFVLESVATVARKLCNVRFVVKPHPAMPLRLVGVKLYGGNIEVTERSLYQCFAEAKAVVCGGITTAGLEAMALGRPAIYVAAPGRRVDISLPEGVPHVMWRIAQNISELTAAIETFICADRGTWAAMHHAKKEIGEKYFQPITEQGIAEFLEA